MDVEVVRSGGIAGLRLSWTVNVDDQPDPEEWVLLIERLPWGETPEAPLEPERPRMVVVFGRTEDEGVDGLDREGRGDFAGLVAAHPVGNDEKAELRRDEEGVLVLLPYPSRMGRSAR